MGTMAARKGAKRNNVFTIDVSEPFDRTIIDATAFADFLRNNIKVAGKAGNLGDNVVVANDANKPPSLASRCNPGPPSQPAPPPFLWPVPPVVSFRVPWAATPSIPPAVCKAALRG